MNADTQRARAAAFLALHHGDAPLILANAWDAVSARIFERAGFAAIASTSAGIAWSLGYADGEVIPRDEMIAAVARIVHAVNLPVTADLESGYGPSALDVADTVRLAIGAGAVGMNLEDGRHGDAAGGSTLNPLDEQVERVAAARSAADAAGLPFVLNARTDVFLHQIGAPEGRLRAAVERANAYRAAGADCLFVPGVVDAETIGALVREIDGPLNILAGPGIPTVAELTRLGVARVSVGGGPLRMALGAVAKASAELLRDGRYDAMFAGGIPYAELNVR